MMELQVILTILITRKDTSMPIRAGVFFDMFPFCILYEVTKITT